MFYLFTLNTFYYVTRWRIVTHGAIDGYSRLPVYLKASSNNKAETVFQCFQQAVREYGLPSRVRSDKGGENVQVSAYMLNQRGTGRGSMITGDFIHVIAVEYFSEKGSSLILINASTWIALPLRRMCQKILIVKEGFAT